MKNKCALCNSDSELINSHIIPKFIFDELKSSGSPIRATTNLNKRVQDGLKIKLLCRNCEDLFQKRETWFSNNIFHPYLKKSKQKFNYDKNLFYFLVSVAWRIMTFHHLKNGNKIRSDFLDAKKEWGEFLFNNTPPSNYSKVHLFFTSITSIGSSVKENLNSYLTRSIHTDIYDKDNLRFLYFKFQKFIVFIEINGFQNDDFHNTLIFNSSGTINFPQKIYNPNVGEFLVKSATSMNKSMNEEISEKQKEKIRNGIQKYSEPFFDTDLYKAIEADHISNLLDIIE